MSDIEISFDLLESKQNDFIPLNDRNILSLLKSPPQKDKRNIEPQTHLPVNKTKHSYKKSYGQLETQKENYDDKNNSWNVLENRYKAPTGRKRYISDISVYTELNTESLINNTANLSPNNTFLKKFSSKRVEKSHQKDVPKLLLSFLDNKDGKGNKRATNLLVFGHQNELYKQKECKRKTHIFNKHLNANRIEKPKRNTVNSRSHIFPRDMKRKTILKSSYDLGLDVKFEDDEAYDKELKDIMKTLGSSVTKFDTILKNTVYNVFKKSGRTD